MSIKKQYQDIIELLEANKNKKVATMLPQLEAMMSGKSNAKTFYKDENDKVIAIYCYYHKCWELVEEVEYGNKASTATGLNTMCKDGVSLWSKQQRLAKKAKEELLTKVASGEVLPSDIEDANEAIEADRNVIVPQDDRVAYVTLEDAINA